LIQWSEDLPKIRSDKIMDFILRKISANEHEQLGDTSTLVAPNVLDALIANRV
jgi:acetyl-CoA synthetase